MRPQADINDEWCPCTRPRRVSLYHSLSVAVLGTVLACVLFKCVGRHPVAPLGIESSPPSSSAPSGVFAAATLRILKPELVDAVVADTNRSDLGTLAAALMWTRKRESQL